MGQLFGTDGIRGVANKDLTPELALKAAKATAFVLNKKLNKKAKVIIGSDTRISASMLIDAMSAGFCSAGADVYKLGIIPTPAIPILLKHFEADIGVMISASHNPAKYNGIKLFDKNGFKLPDAVENEIEQGIFEGVTTDDENVGKVFEIADCADIYANKVKEFVSASFKKDFKVIIDCANGASSVCAEKIFSAINADFTYLNNDYDGYNINKKCGSIYVEELGKEVVKQGADLGIAFDGDADRCLICDEKGRVLDGDRIIASIALDLKANGKLNNNKIAVTTMSNMGFLKYMSNHGIDYELTRVGDRYVLEEMLKSDLSIGGEQSGHIILLDRNSTGDGEMTAVAFLEVLAKSGRKASEYYDDVVFYPQISVNIKADSEMKAALTCNEKFMKAVEDKRTVLADKGRIIVRPSGTEPLVRIMVEGENEVLVKQISGDLVLIAQKVISDLEA